MQINKCFRNPLNPNRFVCAESNTNMVSGFPEEKLALCQTFNLEKKLFEIKKDGELAVPSSLLPFKTSCADYNF